MGEWKDKGDAIIRSHADGMMIFSANEIEAIRRGQREERIAMGEDPDGDPQIAVMAIVQNPHYDEYKRDQEAYLAKGLGVPQKFILTAVYDSDGQFSEQEGDDYVFFYDDESLAEKRASIVNRAGLVNEYCGMVEIQNSQIIDAGF